MTHWFAKIFGWSQFVMTAISQIASSNPVSHGWQGWVTGIASLAVAIGVHAASSTDGTK
jgi:hypothetical protein